MAAVAVLALVVGILMTTCRTTPRREVSYCRVTLTALRPVIAMIARVDSETRGIVIHRIRREHRLTVAHGTVVRELLRHVVGIGHSLVIRCVAHIAIRIVQLVVAVRVAGLALDRCMRARQRESCRAMVKCRRIPCRC